MSLPVNTDSIPVEMKAHSNWVLWKYRGRRDRNGNVKKTKVLYQINGKPAESNNPETWKEFETVVKTLRENPNKFDGMGFVFSQDTGIMGIDFDHVINPVSGEWDQEAIEEIQGLNSYTEISPSGEGAHVIVMGAVPLTAEDIKKERTGRKNDKLGREMYHSGRYFTVTGNKMEKAPGTINQAQEKIDALFSKWFIDKGKKKEKINNKKIFASPLMSDEEVLQHCRTASNNEKFTKLYDKGDTSDYDNDQSRADLALCNIFGFYTQNKEQIDRLFSRSKLHRDKWDRKDYKNRTINEALSEIDEVFKGDTNSLYPYVLTEKGVGKRNVIQINGPKELSDYEITIDYFLYTPVKITALSDDLDGEKILYKIEINHPVSGHIDLWKEQGELLTRAGINKLLNEGLIGTDSSYKDITEYFVKDILRAAKDAKKEFITHKTGWKRNNTIFVAGNEAYSAEGVTPVNLTNKKTSEIFTQAGTLENWVNAVRWIMQDDSTRINTYVAVSAIVAGYLRQPSPILQNKGITTSGKTLKSSTAVSMFGDPTELVKSADTTRTAAERDAIATDGMCSVLDEVGMLKNPDGLTYLLSNGRKKQRGTKEGLEESEHWFKSFILNGEFEFLKESAAQGEIGRLIECPWTLPVDAVNAKRTEVEIRENYGYIIPLFMRKFFSKIDTIKDRYTSLCSELPSSNLDIGSRLRDSFALIIIAGEILEKVFESIGIEKKEPYAICEKLYIENITSERVKPYWIRGLNIIFDEVNACKMEVREDGEETGRFYYKGQMGGDMFGLYIDIHPATFRDICEKHGLKHTQLMQEWRDKELTEVDKPENNGSKKSLKTVKEDRKTKKVLRLIKKKVYEALDIINPVDSEREKLDKAMLKHDIKKHLHSYKETHEMDGNYTGFVDSFFIKYPNLSKHYNDKDIIQLVYDIEIYET